MEASVKIVKVLGVRDTRAFEEVGRNGRDVMVPVPGTGEERNGDRCARVHEVHATVLLSDDTTAVVGTGCMRGDAMLPELRRLASRATTRAKLLSKLNALTRRMAEIEAVKAEVDALPVPEVTVERLDVGRVFRCGDAHAWDRSLFADPEERADCARACWRNKRLHERGSNVGESTSVRAQAEAVMARLARLVDA